MKDGESIVPDGIFSGIAVSGFGHNIALEPKYGSLVAKQVIESRKYFIPTIACEELSDDVRPLAIEC
jgi:hypothetical protein